MVNAEWQQWPTISLCRKDRPGSKVVYFRARFPATVNTADLVNVDVTDVYWKFIRIYAHATQISKRNWSQDIAVVASQEQLPSAVLLLNNAQDPVVFIPTISRAPWIAQRAGRVGHGQRVSFNVAVVPTPGSNGLLTCAG